MNINITIKDMMNVSGVKFGTSGLRGLVDQLSDELCYSVVRAFLLRVVKTFGPDKRVVLGHDLRSSSPRLVKICPVAINNFGGEVVYAGGLPTPALAFYAYDFFLPAIIVTGSHILFDRNGIKFYKSTGEISKSDELLIQQTVIDSFVSSVRQDF